MNEVHSKITHLASTGIGPRVAYIIYINEGADAVYLGVPRRFHTPGQGVVCYYRRPSAVNKGPICTLLQARFFCPHLPNSSLTNL